MAQYGRPDADISNAGTFSPEPLYAELDEITADDTTTEISEKNIGIASDMFEVSLSAVTDPTVHTAHHLRVRLWNDGPTGDFNFHLYQGTTLIASLGDTAPTAAYATYTINLTTGEAGNITDYTDLRCRMTSTAGMGGGTTTYVTWIEFECPSLIYSRTATITSTADVDTVRTPLRIRPVTITGAATATTSILVTRSPTITGSGDVTAAHVKPATATIDADGDVATIRYKLQTWNRVVQLTALGDMDVAWNRYVPRTASITGTATLDVDHSHLLIGVFSAVGNVVAAVTKITTWLRTASVTGTGTVSASIVIYRSSTTIGASGFTATVTGAIRGRSAIVVGAGTVASTYSVFRARTTLSTGAGSVSITTEVYRSRAASIVAASWLTVVGLRYRKASIAGTGTVSTAYINLRPVTITGTASVTATHFKFRLVTASITATASVVATELFIGTKYATASIAAHGDMYVAHTYHLWTGTFAASGDMDVIATKIGSGIIPRNAVIATTGTVVAVPGGRYSRKPVITGTASITVDTTCTFTRSAVITAVGVVTAGLIQVDNTAGFSGSSTMTAVAHKHHHAEADFVTAGVSVFAGQRVVNHTIEFGPGGVAFYPEDYFEEDWYDDDYFLSDPGGMVGQFNAVGSLISRSQIIAYTGDANFRALGTFIPSWITYDGTADFGGTGVIAAAGNRVRGGTIQFSAVGQMGIAFAPGQAAFIGTLTFAAPPHVHRGAVIAQFVNSGFLEAPGYRVRNHDMAMTGVATLTLDGVVIKGLGYRRYVFIELRRRRVA